MTTKRRHRVRTHGRESRERNNVYLGRHDPKQVLDPATHDIYLGSDMCRSEARYHASIPANRNKNENRSSKAFSPFLFLVDAVHAFLPLVFLSLGMHCSNRARRFAGHSPYSAPSSLYSGVSLCRLPMSLVAWHVWRASANHYPPCSSDTAQDAGSSARQRPRSRQPRYLNTTSVRTVSAPDVH
jgi:hypothetical protein